MAVPPEQLGYDGTVFMLAMDHRGSFRRMLGIGPEPTAEQHARLRDAKRLVWEGLEAALEQGAPRESCGLLVDEEMGAGVAREAAEAGVDVAMPVEASGRDVFEFEYGEDFGEHIERFDPTFSKVLVRWNPSDPPEDKQAQGERLARLGDWLHERGRLFLFELLVPASDLDLARVDGDEDRYDRELRPDLTMEAIEEIRSRGVEPDIWKIEGLDRGEDCERLGGLVRSGGRDRVAAVILGRGSDDSRVDHWLTMGAPVEAYQGFAIGRSIWRDEVAAYAAGDRSRDEAAAGVSDRFRRFIDVYQQAASQPEEES